MGFGPSFPILSMLGRGRDGYSEEGTRRRGSESEERPTIFPPTFPSGEPAARPCDLFTSHRCAHHLCQLDKLHSTERYLSDLVCLVAILPPHSPSYP